MKEIAKLLKMVKAELSVTASYRAGQLRQFSATNEKRLINRHCRPQKQVSTKALDLGCGIFPKNPFNATLLQGVDIRENHEHNVVAADLCSGCIPFPDNSFDYITAFDLIEHIPRVIYINGKSRFPFVELMSEIHRVMKEGGIFYSQTPAYPSKEAFQDPTHVNIITEDTFPSYFCGDDPWARMYGFKGAYNLIAQGWCGCRLLTLMRKATEGQ